MTCETVLMTGRMVLLLVWSPTMVLGGDTHMLWTRGIRGHDNCTVIGLPRGDDKPRNNINISRTNVNNRQ